MSNIKKIWNKKSKKLVIFKIMILKQLLKVETN